jgi:hypothetical protein
VMVAFYVGAVVIAVVLLVGLLGWAIDHSG